MPNRHPLLKWAEDEKQMNQVAFVKWAATEWGITEHHVRHILTRRRYPGFGLALRMSKKTGIEVSELASAN